MKTLPEPRKAGKVSVEETLAARRSVRAFAASPLTDEELSQLLWAAQGITDSKRRFRTAPSAGATYPLVVYVAKADGVFRYHPEPHTLEAISDHDIRRALARAALDQSCVRQAAAVMIFAAVPERTTRRYGQRGERYILMEVGHAAQNVHLQAVALGLGSVPVGAFDEEAIAAALGGHRGEEVLYLVPIGRPAR